MDLLLSFLLFVCLGTFLCNPKVASGDQTAAYKETAGGTMNCSRFPMSSSCQPHFYSFNDNILPFTAAVTIFYNLAALSVYFSGCAWDLESGN